MAPVARTVAGIGLLIVAGCANQPCDPALDRSIFQVAGCVVGGGYDARLAQLQAQLNEAEADRAGALTLLRQAESRRDAAQARGARLRSELAAQRARSIRLQRELLVAHGRAGLDQARLDQIEAQAATLRARQDALRGGAAGGAANDAEVARMRQRQQMLEREWEQVQRVAPRD